MRAIIFLFLLAVAIAGSLWAWPRLESDPPTLSGPEEILLGARPLRVPVAWADPGMGLAEVRAIVRGSGDAAGQPLEIELYRHTTDPSRPGRARGPITEEDHVLVLDAAALGLPDGEFNLVLSARDNAWSGFGAGNHAERVIPIRVDTQPPRVQVESGLTYVRRGGSALAVYRVDADAERSGVRVGESFFPGFRQVDGRHVAVFAIPVESPESVRVEIIGIDAFGNEEAIRFNARVMGRSIPEISIPLSDGFLEQIDERFRDPAEDDNGASALAVFQRVNTRLREANETRIAEAIGEPTTARWSGAFGQMRGSKVMSEFAEIRHYTRHGKRASRARHYGYDLASTARAPITASNAGTVIFAGDNGIYGKLVLIDHGLGITTLYGHLSSLEVSVGQSVSRDQVLGRSGATGLAGGDHLHFAVLVAHTYVDPLEWWDRKWVREHIESRLTPR